MSSRCLTIVAALCLAACGGSVTGGPRNDGSPEDTTDTNDTQPEPEPEPEPAPTPEPDPEPALTDADRAAAARATATSTTNDCATGGAFYWEIGRSDGVLVSGSVGSDYDADTLVSIASASKWFYGAYVIERRAGNPTDEDIKYLNFKSGYTSFAVCPAGTSIDGCLAFGTNGDYHADQDGLFHYGGGHMEKHASLMGLGAMKNADLTAEVRRVLGSEVTLSYNNPQPAGGGAITATGYAIFLRKLLSEGLFLSGLLGTHAVCTNPLTCGEATSTPVPGNESWHYSLGHWVEDDPVVGDGAFSSAGAFGFYPWIDAGKTTYGIVARESASSAMTSVHCGRMIRKAWMTGVAQ